MSKLRRQQIPHASQSCLVVVLTALWLLCCLSFTQASEPLVAGEWSTAVNGLRARLLYSEVNPKDGPRYAHVYLELENVSESADPLLIDRQSPDIEVLDAAGKSVPQKQPDEVTTNPPYTMTLPLGATLRLRICIADWKVWLIPNGSGDERFLTGSFTVPEFKKTDLESLINEHKRRHVWRGTLKLPKLKVPTAASE